LRCGVPSLIFPVHLLFVKLKHIGDALLMTPTMVAVKQAYPQAKIWVVVRRGCEGILDGCPAIDRVLTAAEPNSRDRSRFYWLSEVRMLGQLRAQQWNFAFELGEGDRGRWLVGFSGAMRTCTHTGSEPLNWFWKRRFNAVTDFPWFHLHRAEKDYQAVNAFLPLGANIPGLSFDRSRIRPWAGADALTEFAVIHPATRWQRKRWPEENWIGLGRRLLADGLQLVLSCGPDAEEVESIGRIQQALGPGVIGTAGKLDWAQLAGLLYRARLFVGVDTAAMHLAAACQCPAVVLFGPSCESMWRPWNAPHQLITPTGWSLSEVDAAALQQLQGRRTQDIGLDQVIAACRQMLTVGHAE